MEHDTLWFDKKSTLTHKAGQQKISVATNLAAVLLACVLSVCVALFWSHTAFALVQPLLFLAVGGLHAFRLEKNFLTLTRLQKWVYTATVAATIFLLFALFSLWKLHLPLLMMLAGSAAFLLPAVVVETLRTYMQLTFGQANVWQPTREAFLTYPDVYMKGIPVRFNVSAGPNGLKNFRTTFRVLADMKLGEAFCNMAQKQAKKGDDTVALFDAEKKLYQWTFATRNVFGWDRVLDPTLSLEENNLGKNSVVYAQRLPPDATLIAHEQTRSNSSS